MIAVDNVEIQNLSYVAGAIVLIIILALVVTIRHRKPKSVESNMASFNKGLRALAPDAEPVRRRSRPAPPVPPRSPLPSRTKTVQTIKPIPVTVPLEEDPSELGDEPVADGDREDPSPSPEPEENDGDPTVRIDATDTPTSLEAETG